MADDKTKRELATLPPDDPVAPDPLATLPPTPVRNTTSEFAPGERDPGESPPGDAPVDVLAVGARVGRYIVVERLGAGAMGVIYAAYDPKLDRRVALKLLRPHGGGGDQARRTARLEREAQAVAKLSHPNVVGIFDVLVHDDHLVLAMEYLAGGTLTSWLAAEKRPWRRILQMFVDLGRGLAAAHAEGQIHRDFKPDNVLLDKSGVPKVVDFGLVRMAASSSGAHRAHAEDAEADADAEVAHTAPANLTRTGALAGTPAYMAPEQFIRKPVDARTDQFAFCVALYEALYGERPFPGDTILALAASVTSGRMRAAPKAADVPGWVRRALLRGLSTNPEQRFARFEELTAVLANDPIVRRRRLIVAGAALVVLVVLVVLVQQSAERRRADFEKRIAAQVSEGERAWKEADSLAGNLNALRTRSYALFDAHDRESGERIWAEALTASETFDAALDRAQRALDAALVMDQSRGETRRQLAAILFDRALQAEREFRPEDLARYLSSLDSVDTTGEQRRRWRQPGTVSIETNPPGAVVSIDRFEVGEKTRIVLVPVASKLAAPIAGRSLPPGSYRLRLEKPGRADTTFPFVVKRGDALSFTIPLPEAQDIPPDFRYVPAGRFLYGDQDEESRGSFLNAVPIHERELPAFLIEAHETTFGEWIEFLAGLPTQERLARSPASKTAQGMVAVSEHSNGGWTLRLSISNRPLEASSGEALVYPGRPSGTAVQNWLRMPVVGISAKDVEAYLRWLSASGKVPGARLCKEAEWERAARGADQRAYPNAMLRLNPADANFDATYGRRSGAYGPDEVGRHPASSSPFGVDDMAGNAWEITMNDDPSGAYVARGGCYYEQMKSSRSTNREPIEIELRSHMLGFRVCADFPNKEIRGTNK